MCYSSLGLPTTDLDAELSASQVISQKGRWVQDQTRLPHEGPASLQVLGSTGELKVANVY